MTCLPPLIPESIGRKLAQRSAFEKMTSAFWRDASLVDAANGPVYATLNQMCLNNGP
jgi:hypothetical protein